MAIINTAAGMSHTSKDSLVNSCCTSYLSCQRTPAPCCFPGLSLMLPPPQLLGPPNQVCRYADGYQPHLVSPEKGVKALAQEALDLVEGPVKGCVQGVHTLLYNAARWVLMGVGKSLREREERQGRGVQGCTRCCTTQPGGC